MLYLVWVFKDLFSYVVFALLLTVSLYGFKVFSQPEGGEIPLIHTLLGIFYSLLFALVGTCLAKTLKDKTLQVWKSKKPLNFAGQTLEFLKKGKIRSALKTFSLGFVKLLAILLGIFGLGAAQFCVFGSPVCTFSVGTAIVTALLPSFAVSFLAEYGKVIVLVAIVVQLIGLYFMGCFKKVRPIEGV
ncbi:MAG: hypothetical protein DSZ31_03390 [Gammaproteobacteria bacterium]|nr:MAG: hypothetical protein DSZ31_03390 [Gammaproteobacteria bacterium]